MTLLFLFLLFHIYKVQVVDGAKWLELAEKRWSTTEVFKAKRGTITDRNGNVLAMDALAYNISINPKVIQSSDTSSKIVKGLSEILDITESQMNDYVNAKRDDGTYYSNRELRKGGWQIEKEVADAVKEFSNSLKKELIEKKLDPDPGIYITETYERYYPRQELASQVIGYISLDGENKMGLESTYNDVLTGTDGYIQYLKDGKKVQLLGSDVDQVPVKDGEQLELTLDIEIQNFAEDALRDVVKKYNPKSATAIVANPKTMEILAMANMPEFNPNKYGSSDYASMYNHAVGSLYEPGSTFKIATLAAAIEEGVFDPEEQYMSGTITVSGDPRPIRDHNRVGWGRISFLEGLKFSSNVAFVKLGYERIGAEKLKAYLTSFGFAQKTGIGLSNEAAGTIRFQSNRDVASATFGQGGVLVTPLQQVAAVAAVANGGNLMKPYIIKSVTDPLTKTTTVNEPTIVRRVISEQSSKLANEYLEQVVSDRKRGTGRNAYIEGYRVAGKTGTAQKVINGKYSDKKFVVSFIGYAPVDDPQLIVYVIVDEPNDSLAGGGAVAAPVFREILLKSLKRLNIPPNFISEIDETVDASAEITVKVPDVTGMKGALAKEKLKAVGLSNEFVGDGTIIEQQIPSAGSLVHPAQKIFLITEQKQNLKIPKLTGVSLRDAAEITALLGVKLVVEGNGYVVSQRVEENNGVKTVHIQLSPLPESEFYIEHEINEDEEVENEDEVDDIEEASESAEVDASEDDVTQSTTIE